MTLDLTTGAAAGSQPASAAPATPAECANCGLPRAGEFCAACGQRAVRGRLTVRGIVQQVARDVLNLDRGVLFTALELTRHPGGAIRDYVDGKRVRYTGPVKYFVLTVALATFVTTQTGVLNDVASGMVEGMGDTAPVTVDQTSRFMSQWMTLFMAVGVPFTAWVTRRLFGRAGMTYAEHLVLNLYAYGQQSLALALTLLVALALPGWQAGLMTAWTAAAVLHFGWACWMPGDEDYWEPVNTVVDGDDVAFSCWFGPLRPTYGSGKRIPVFKSWGAPSVAGCTHEFLAHEHDILLPTTTFVGLRESLREWQGVGGIWFAGGWTRWFDSQEAALDSATWVADRLPAQALPLTGPARMLPANPVRTERNLRRWLERVARQAPETHRDQLAHAIEEVAARG